MRLQPSINLLSRQIEMLHSPPFHLPRDKRFQQRPQHGELLHNTGIRQRLDRAEDQLNPRVQLAIFQTIKGLAEHQVTRDIESGIVHPILDIHRRFIHPGNLAPQLANQSINIPSNQPLLFSQSPFRERMRKEPSLPCMHAIIDRTDEMVDTIRRREVVATVFGETASWSCAVDIAEGLGGVEREFVGGDPYDGAVAFM